MFVLYQQLEPRPSCDLVDLWECFLPLGALNCRAGVAELRLALCGGRQSEAQMKNNHQRLLTPKEANLACQTTRWADM